jgi:glycosyltransferase involved in cell wall biosynthesis
MIALWIRQKWNIPYIVSEQSSMYNKAANDNFFKKNFLHRYNVKRIFQNATVVTNVSYTIGERLKALFNLSAVKVIHNTVNTGFFNYGQMPSPKFRFIHVSTLTHQKNVEGILRTISRLKELHKNFELVIVGPLQPGLEEMVKQLGLQFIVSFTGEITYPEVAVQMKNASAFVMFSRHENFPCVMVEALCCGLPFIGTGVGGIAEAIDAGNGMIVPSENEQELFLAMSRMINEYQKFNREKIAFDAQLKYSYTSIGKQFLELYSELLKGVSTF